MFLWGSWTSYRLLSDLFMNIAVTNGWVFFVWCIPLSLMRVYRTYFEHVYKRGSPAILIISLNLFFLAYINAFLKGNFLLFLLLILTLIFFLNSMVQFFLLGIFKFCATPFEWVIFVRNKIWHSFRILFSLLIYL